jgi:hypothetical protein
MEYANAPKPSGKRGQHRRRGKVMPRVPIEDRVIKAQVPPGSRFKGYETFVVQGIVLRAEAPRRYVTDGNDGPRRKEPMVFAPLPAGVTGRRYAPRCRYGLSDCGPRPFRGHAQEVGRGPMTPVRHGRDRAEPHRIK